MATRTTLATLVALHVAGCVIIVNPDDGNTPVPVPVPLVCSVDNEQPVAHVYFSARIERSTVNLTGAYSNFMQRTVIALAGAGIQTTQAVLVRADERAGGRPLLAAWGCRLDSPQELLPEDVIQWYAINEPLDEEQIGCVTDPLVDLGEHLNEVVTQYPGGLRGRDGLSVFGGAPDVVLVVHIDPSPRRSSYDRAECASAVRMTAVAPDGTAGWLAYAGEDLPADRVLHWFVSTPEGVDRPTFVDACRNQEGFPSHLLDSIEPSALAVYGPASDQLKSVGSPASTLDFCRMLADDRAFLARGAVDVAAAVGLDVPIEQIEDVLEQGLPLPEDSGGVDGDGLSIPGKRPGT